MSGKNKCQTCGPGYASPLAAMKGPKEKLLYVVCIQPHPKETQRPDYLATVDVDPESPTYCQVIHRTFMKNVGDELHHSGWNICSSCYHGGPKDKKCNLVRDKLVLPCLGSDRIYIVDVGKNERAPEISKIIEPEEMRHFNCTSPHTTHCLASGDIMISTMGDVDGNGKGDFILVDSETFKVKGTWTAGKTASFGYDFWYQPYWDIMVASEWGAPRIFKRGYQPSDPHDISVYGRSLNFYSWKERKLIKTTNLGDEGIAPLEVRFLHNPKRAEGFVGCCVNANVFRFFKKDDGNWETKKVIDIPAKKVSGWAADTMQGMMSDILLSLDDKYLYFSLWLHGDVRQYDISDPANPKLTGQVFLGGSIQNDSGVKVLEDKEQSKQPSPVCPRGRRLQGGPQMLQLSLDGKRLYVSNSLFSPWDHQFYPDMIKHGSHIVKIDVDTENGGLKLDEDFLVDFGKDPDGPVLAHEMRYPGGDCTSDIWMVEKEDIK